MPDAPHLSFPSLEDTTRRPGPGAKPSPAALDVGSVLEVGGFLDDAVEALAGLRGAAVADARLFGFVEA
ncbi:hypothetical protein J2T11_003441, partial [Paenarthrobacter nicotinovorans]|uniref:hypothetical protein n=1 Tax=Paenarthrobacter nicotinovorans TaxID=29320 RepID=UPI0027849AE6